MIVPKRGEHIAPFDVDNTLVMHDNGPLVIQQPIGNGDHILHHVTPNQVHIDCLKTMKHRGNLVIVWSASGQGWAEAVVKALGIEKYVDIVISKPNFYFDDKPVSEWMTERVYVTKKGS